MGTKVVKKGSGRPSAMAKKSRHDQRTPLPPKGSAKDPRTSREKREQVADDVGSNSRAIAFAAFAKEHDWWAGVEYDGDADLTRVTVKRDDGRYKETITAEWIGSRVPDGGVNYSVVGGRSIRLRNVSAARQHIDGSKMVNRDAPERKAKRSHTVTIKGPDGEEQVIDNYPKPVGADIVDNVYHLRAVPDVRNDSGHRLAPIIHQFPAMEQQVRSFRERNEANGYTVDVVKHTDDGCSICLAGEWPSDAGKPAPRKKAATKRAPAKAPAKKAAAAKKVARKRGQNRVGDGLDDLRDLLTF